MRGLIRRHIYFMKGILTGILSCAVLVFILEMSVVFSMKCGNLHKYGITIDQYGENIFFIIVFLNGFLILSVLVVVSIIAGKQKKKCKEMLYSTPITYVHYVISFYIVYLLLLVFLLLYNIIVSHILSLYFHVLDNEEITQAMWAFMGVALFFIDIMVPCSMLFHKYSAYVSWGIIFVLFMVLSAVLDSIPDKTVISFIENNLISFSVVGSILFTVLSVFCSIIFEKRRRFQ